MPGAGEKRPERAASRRHSARTRSSARARQDAYGAPSRARRSQAAQERRGERKDKPRSRRRGRGYRRCRPGVDRGGRDATRPPTVASWFRRMRRRPMQRRKSGVDAGAVAAAVVAVAVAKANRCWRRSARQRGRPMLPRTSIEETRRRCARRACMLPRCTRHRRRSSEMAVHPSTAASAADVPPRRS